MRPKTSRDFIYLGAGLLALLWFIRSGWLTAIYNGGPLAILFALIAAALLAFVIGALWPVATQLLSALLSGDPYWIAPREFDTQHDPKKTQALMQRLAAIDKDEDARLWQDQETGQLWASKRFDSPDGEFTRFKPLKNRLQWLGMDDSEWSLDP